MSPLGPDASHSDPKRFRTGAFGKVSQGIAIEKRVTVGFTERKKPTRPALLPGVC